jgi:two-component system response regulator GlrR
LRERKDDIPHLVDHFLKKICVPMKKDVKGISPEGMRKLMLHDWPGNVRELENTLEYAVAMTHQDVLQEDLILPTDTSAHAATADLDLVTRLLPEEGAATSLKAARAEFEKVYLIRLLELCGGGAAKAAQIAGKYRADFYDLLKKHGIKIQDFKRSK